MINLLMALFSSAGDMGGCAERLDLAPCQIRILAAMAQQLNLEQGCP